ncbi:RNA polymerase sigma factor [Agrobacterium sp. OT33]|uniref:RNA polymerase sigma factor n=1 Tax=Agrobacterium sp. OT33 TaxID=2815338 RepID=UPI001A8F1DE9|nr:RNA polymerase sigma factor [Agrobacterium sp. OT33]MBO0128373.1 RNA polymerase sigma factor [Agrobacterium sp. OT33]
MGVGKNSGRYALYLQNRKALVDYATPLVGSKAEAEDVVQDAYLQFVPDKADENVPHKGYLFQIVRNLSFNRRRRKKREEALPPEDVPWWALPAVAETPENQLLFCERVKCVATAMEDLPKRNRLVLEMYRFDGLSLKEIAAALDLSVTTVHRLLNEAASEIKEKMES